jgi:hypothetical protein
MQWQRQLNGPEAVKIAEVILSPTQQLALFLHSTRQFFFFLFSF